MKNRALIHGENGFKPVAKLPKGKKATYNSFIAGHSETGHHHVLECEEPFTVVESEGKTFVELIREAKVVHQKSFDIHETKVLQPGVYEISHKTEYDPFAKVVRQVWD